jgi:class 3 adenylate cyclase
MASSFENILNLTSSLEEISISQDTFVIFIDMCESTEFKQYCLQNEIPDSVWIVRQYMFLERCSTIIRSYNGIIIKTIGDEIMATFGPTTDPLSIIRCIIEIFGTFINIKAYNKGRFIINSKASIDFGESYNGSVIDNDLFDPIGSCVDRCARILKFASKKEIALSRDYYNLISNEIDTLGIKIELKREELKGLGYVDFYILKY